MYDQKNKANGILASVIAAILFGLCATLTKFLSVNGVSVGVIIFGRSTITAVFLLIYGGVVKKPVRISRALFPKTLLLGILGNGLTLLFLNIAYNILPVGTVTTIHFMYPVVVSIITACIFKEHLPKVTVITLIVTTCTLFMFFEGFSPDAVYGLVPTILSIFTWSFQLVYMEHSGLLTLEKHALTFFCCLPMAAMGLIWGLINKDFSLLQLVYSLPLLALIALLNNVIAGILSAKAVETIGAGLSSVCSVFEPIGSIVFGVLLLHEQLSFCQILGCIIIISCITTMIVINCLRQK